LCYKDVAPLELAHRLYYRDVALTEL